MEPVISWMAGSPADAAPISCAGTVLSQPPTSTTESMGCAATIASATVKGTGNNLPLDLDRTTTTGYPIVLVQPGEYVRAGQELARLAACGDPLLTAEVDDRTFRRVQLGQRAEFRPNGSRQRLEGEVIQTMPTNLTPGDPRTRPQILLRIAGILEKEHGATAHVIRKKKSAGSAPSPEMIAEYKKDCDIVVAGVGD